LHQGHTDDIVAVPDVVHNT